ncbi:MAG: hypothetical protein LUF04_06980 [Bacteroides sp.]|nr:hypothetical protein [Bacteroides sp.]
MSETKTKFDVVRLKGLKSVEICPADEYGESDANWYEWGQTSPDSFVISKGDDSVTEEFIEEADDAIDELTTEKGTREITWNTKNLHPDVFTAVMGGEFKNGQWAEPVSSDAKEVALKITSVNDVVIEMPRVKIRVSGDIKFSKNALSELTIKGKQLAPGNDKSGFIIKYPSEVTSKLSSDKGQGTNP